MKRSPLIILPLAAVAMCMPGEVRSQDRTPTRRQADRPRDLMVVVRDTDGHSRDDIDVSAFNHKSGRAAELKTNRRGERLFRVVDGDTLDVFILGGMLEFPVAEVDTLLLSVSGVPLPEPDSLNYVDAVVVTGKREVRVDTGFGYISPKTYGGAGGLVSMTQAKFHHDLQEFLMVQGHTRGLAVANDGSEKFVYIRGSHQLRLQGGEIIPPLYVVDGVPVDNDKDTLTTISASYPMDQIESIFVMKSTPRYGPRGYGGVIVITTKQIKPAL